MQTGRLPVPVFSYSPAPKTQCCDSRLEIGRQTINDGAINEQIDVGWVDWAVSSSQFEKMYGNGIA